MLLENEGFSKSQIPLIDIEYLRSPILNLKFAAPLGVTFSERSLGKSVGA
jgi:hypothetical protein